MVTPPGGSVSQGVVVDPFRGRLQRLGIGHIVAEIAESGADVGAVGDAAVVADGVVQHLFLRPIAGVHYVSDVISGFLISALFGILFFFIL